MQVEHKVSELSPEDRAVVERLLGRALNDSDVVFVSAEEAAEKAKRAEATRRLLESMDRMAARVADVPEAEVDATIDEALLAVRGRSH